MSQSILTKYAVLDPRLQMNSNFTKWYTMVGSNIVNCINMPTTAFSSNFLSFNVILPDNRSCIIDRSSVIVALPIRLTILGTNTGTGNIYRPEYEGLRAHAFSKIVQTCNIGLNGNNLSYQMREQSLIQERFDINKNNMQIEPSFCDRAQSYASMDGTNMSPFRRTYDNTSGEMSRRAYPITVVSNSTTSAVLEFILYHNLMDYSPFTSQTDVPGINIVPFTLNYSFVSQLTHMWSRDVITHPQPFTNMSVTIGTTSEMQNPQISMMVLSLPSDIPPAISYPYHLTMIQPTQNATPLAPNARVSDQTTNVIQLDTIPSMIYIYAKPSTQLILSSIVNSVQYPDCFANISKIAITLGNKSNLLASMMPQQLYWMTKRNLLNDCYSYSDWLGKNGDGSDGSLMGSIIAINPSTDLSLEEDRLVGLAAKTNFQCTVTYTNIGPYTLTYDLCVMISYDGIQTMNYGKCDLDIMVIKDKSELQVSPMSYHQMKCVYGGAALAGDFKGFMKNIFSKLKSVAGPTNEFLKSSKLISQLTPYVPMIGPELTNVARNLGYGSGGFIAGNSGGDFYTGIDDKGGDGGDSMAGGRVLRRSSLQKNIKQHR